MPTATAGTAGTAAERLSRVAGHLLESSGPSLTEQHVADFERDGFVVLKNAFTDEELEALKEPINRAYDAQQYGPCGRTRPRENGKAHAVYPQPGQYNIGSRMMHIAPEVVPLTCSHPVVVRATSRLLNDRPIVSQYVVYNRTPGAKFGGGSYPENVGVGIHYDYKPWRPVGSFLNWLFAIIPLCDYTDDAGPLMVMPGSHKQSEILESDGRVRMVRCGCIPPKEICADQLVNTNLRKGDLALMHGFTYHEAFGNRMESGNRMGIYMKFHGVHSPPAIGPLIQPFAAKQRMVGGVADVIGDYYREDEKFATIVPQKDGGTGPMETVDHVRLLLERDDGKFLLVKDSGSSHRLPGCPANEHDQYSQKYRDILGYLDIGNVVQGLTTHVRDLVGLDLPYVSWVTDQKSPKTKELSRIFGYRMLPREAEELAKKSLPGSLEWVDPVSLREPAKVKELNLEFGGQEGLWCRMWVDQVDERGEPVLRGIGLAHEMQQKLQGTYNGPGNEADGYVCGERLTTSMDSEGWKIAAPPLKLYKANSQASDGKLAR